MAFCIKCGTELNDGAKFCSGCGANLTEDVTVDQNIVKQSVAKAEKKPKKKSRLGRFVVSFVITIIIGYVGWHIFVGWVNYNLKNAINNVTTNSSNVNTTTNSAVNSNTTKYTSGNFGIDTELKDFLDSYEEFMDEYVAFMKKYNSDPNNMLGMMDEYMQIMTKYTDFSTKADSLDDSQMNDAELKYYTEVMLRVEKKLLEAM